MEVNPSLTIDLKFHRSLWLCQNSNKNPRPMSLAQHNQEGDIILIGTDGIFETRNQDDLVFGQERVRNIISLHKDQPAAVIQKTIVSEVKGFRGKISQEDDITLVVVKAD